MTRPAGTTNVSFRWSAPLTQPAQPAPLCFDEPKDWALWQQANRYLPCKSPSPCCDCLLEFKVSMIKAGRCQKEDKDV